MDRRPPHAGRKERRQLLRRYVCALVVTICAAARVVVTPAQTSIGTACGYDMKLLVLSADGKEAALPAITQTLDYLGTPYRLHIASDHPGALTSDFFRAGCHGNYQGIVQTSASLAYSPDGGTTWASALSYPESLALASYEAEFGIRQVNWYAFPSPDVGLTYTGARGTSDTALPIALTAAGKQVFPYLSLAAAPFTAGASKPSLAIRNAWVYQAAVADASTRPIITDAAGNVLGAIRTAEGRDILTLTFDSNPYLTHSVALGYGLINWVTKGLFIGERHVYMSPQIDDLFLENDDWRANVPCGTAVDGTGYTVRMDGNDFLATYAWQQFRRAVPLTRDLRLTWAFNGSGTEDYGRKDTLTAAAKKYESAFYWVSHTFTHPQLDALPYLTVYDELIANQRTAKTMKFSLYSKVNLVTPEISGLQNAEAMRAAYDSGVRYLVSDTSRAGHSGPAPNVGLANWQVPGIYMIPRRPNNLYYNVSTPAGWTSEYNCMYRGYWGRDLTYQQIVDVESDHLASYLLLGDMDPWMFHQPNTVVYGGGRTLMGDLLDAALIKYAAVYNLPILSPPMEAIGKHMQEKGTALLAGVTGFRNTDGTVTLAAARTATVPLTGAALTGAESYGGQPIAHVTVSGGASVTVKP